MLFATFLGLSGGYLLVSLSLNSLVKFIFFYFQITFITGIRWFCFVKFFFFFKVRQDGMWVLVK